MNILFELSKEHTTLPKAEVLACLQAEGIKYSILEATEDVLIIRTDVGNHLIHRLGERLSFTFYIDELLFSCFNSPDDIKKYAKDVFIDKKGSIAINYKNRSENIDSRSIVKILAEIYTKNTPVNLTNPDVEVRALITDGKVYVGIKIAEVDRSLFEKRKVQYRPFFSPISLHPKLARALVNLSLIKKDETMLDPFCGTGGILLEAGLIGAKIVGSDIEAKMIEGCTKTLDSYKIKNYNLFCSDIGDINKYNVDIDAVVSDLPYGKSTTTKGEHLEQLYKRTFENICNVLKKGRRAVVGLSNKDMVSIGEHYFSLLEVHELRVHRSLTRYFAVFQK